MQSANERSSRDLDKFYTKPEVADKCLRHLQEVLSKGLIDAPDFWLEPGAGAGVFLERLPDPKLGLDILPENPNGPQQAVIQQDFLDWTPAAEQGRIATIGSPPFGKDTEKAVAFFNHAASFSSLIAFIVPRSFENEEFQKRLDRNFHKISEMPLELYAFTLDGAEYPVLTTFQIWKKEGRTEQLDEAETFHPDMEFVSAQDADFAFQNTGDWAGTLKEDCLTTADDQHIYIRARRLDAKTLRDRLQSLDFSEVKSRATGNPCISKSALIKLYKAKWDRSNNQLHGLTLEDFVRKSGKFPGAEKQLCSPTAKVDIPAGFDPQNGLPTSIKATKRSVIDLGDARRIWQQIQAEPLRFLIGRYAQFTNKKTFGEILEIHTSPCMAQDLLGDISLKDVEYFHRGIGLSNFPKGEHARARRWAKEHKSLLENRIGAIHLHPKIDSKSQRRLQCSIDIKRLEAIVLKHKQYIRIHDACFGNIELPFSIQSTPRALAGNE
jgi:hypothetical protein